MKPPSFVALPMLCLCLALPAVAVADWPSDPAVNLPVCTVLGEQFGPAGHVASARLVIVD